MNNAIGGIDIRRHHTRTIDENLIEVLSKLKNRREICVFSPKKSRVRAKSLVSLLLCHYDASHTVPI